METRIIKFLTVATAFLLPFIIFKGFWYGVAFSKIVFLFAIIEFLFLLFLLHSLNKGEISLKKSPISVALLLYLLVMFVSALVGEDFRYSFWSSFSRGTGIITWLHYFSFFLIISSTLTEERDWRNIFRALSLSGLILAVVSFLGVNGLNFQKFAFFEKGTSLLGNTSYSGAYLLLIFFFCIIGFLLEPKKEWKIAYVLSSLLILFNPDLFNFDFLRGSLSLGQVASNPAFLLGLARTSSIVLWLGCFGAFILFLFHKFKNKKTSIGLAVSLLVLLTTCYVYGFNSLAIKREGAIYQKYVEYSGIARPVVWNMALGGIKERPLLGYGMENFIYIYQENLDSRLIDLEGGGQFDEVHNYTLSQLIEVGVLGSLAILVTFIFIVITSFKLYRRHERYYFLLIPFIFFLHFLQMQTFFETQTTLFLATLLLSFLVFREPNITFKPPWWENQKVYQISFVVMFFCALFFFIYLPASENRFIHNYLNNPERINISNLTSNINNLSVDPIETLGIVSKNFSNFSSRNFEMIKERNLRASVEKEFQIYVDAYQKYYPKYSDNYFFLIRYADFMNSASLFGLGSLKDGEEALFQALDISSAYPEPHLMMAMNLYYQGRVKEAMVYAKKGYDINPAIPQSKQVYDIVEKGLKNPNAVKLPIIINLFSF